MTPGRFYSRRDLHPRHQNLISRQFQLWEPGKDQQLILDKPLLGLLFPCRCNTSIATNHVPSEF
jgi:hypothetical protein